MAQKDFGCFQEGMLWPPTHTLNHANAIHSQQKLEEQFNFPTRQPHRHGEKYSSVTESLPPLLHRHTRSTPRPQGTRNPIGPGMQAIFLGSSQKSSGTGFFLPRRGDIDSQFNNKSACSPVLLPARVVQTLNLNVHELGHQIKPHQDVKKSMKGDNKMAKFKRGNDCSPEIFLPKEWTY
ncbi:uncharacterized protein LOC111406984 [Olea europaea var. sylvestris]|uniref:uncharacterized protein LOC111406984 n=1 Tax=Olea europaea var. sylvestris TaxID=158386 RepID=UPI000C1CD3B2|nr:uncharacterized protein LOC111406984 [Olea europaea var. sylvestris]